MNFVLLQILTVIALAFLLIINFCIIRTFVALPFKKLKILFEIILCLVVFAYTLAFRVNFIVF